MGEPRKNTGIYASRQMLTDAIWSRSNAGHRSEVIAAMTGVSDRTVRRILKNGEGKHDRTTDHRLNAPNPPSKPRLFSAFNGAMFAIGVLIGIVGVGAILSAAPSCEVVAAE